MTEFSEFEFEALDVISRNGMNKQAIFLLVKSLLQFTRIVTI